MILQEFIAELPKPEKVERGNGENDRPHKGNTYTNDDNQNAEQIVNPDQDELSWQEKSDKDAAEDTGDNDVI